MQVSKQTKQLVLMAMLTAIVAVLSYLGSFIKVPGLAASISLTLVPVVLGGALVGPLAGAWLGFVSGFVFLLSGFFGAEDAAFWIGLSLLGTVVTVLVKGIVSGLLAGACYRAFERVNRYVAVVVSAIVCPIVNTAIFLFGCRVFFFDAVSSWAVDAGKSIGIYILVVMVGLNFVFELLVNIILSPALLRIIKIGQGSGASAAS